jgi:DNA-binding MarR family transcriptional regulator
MSSDSQTTDSQAFERDLLIVLHDVARMLRTRFDQRARAHGMTRAQWVILARLKRQPGLSQNEMAAICEVEPITVARLVDRLESRGLLERRADPHDRRIKRLHLLPGAQPILDEIALYRDEMHEQLTRGLDAKLQTALVDSLLHLKNNLTAEGAPAPKMQMAGE